MSRSTGSAGGSGRVLARRRRIVAGLNIVTDGVLAAAMARLCAAGGWTWPDVALLLGFLVALPWVVLAFWNAMIGLWLLHVRRDAMPLAAPFAANGGMDAPIRVDTAVVMTLRNEDPARAFARLKAVKRSLDATGWGGKFAYFVLSDTDVPAVASEEEAAFAAWRARDEDAGRLAYRRRAENTGFKGGNLRDFCETHGAAFEFMLPLDADSFMAGETILRMVRIGQADRGLGILQSLVVGMPARSAFARIFQFGMRHGMRPYTMGSTWWSADSGQYWGHNALVRIAPYLAHCALPVLPGGPPLGGRILSHDQVEGALMRSAGYDVRVLPVEVGSYEDNPPTVVEFMRRDMRWCQGNMQYWRLLRRPGFTPTSRFQLLWAVLMYLSPPAVTLMMLAVGVKAVERGFGPAYPAGLAIALYLSFLVLHVSPKLVGFLDVGLTPGGLKRYGGGANFAAGCGLELVAAFLLGAVTAFQTTLFMIGLCFGRCVGWNGQVRDAHALPWKTAVRRLWPQTLFGAALLALLTVSAPSLIGWSLPLTAGLVLAIPFAVVTADPGIGAWLAESGLCGIPEEFDPPAELRLLDRPAGPGAASPAMPAAAVSPEMS